MQKQKNQNANTNTPDLEATPPKSNKFNILASKQTELKTVPPSTTSSNLLDPNPRNPPPNHSDQKKTSPEFSRYQTVFVVCRKQNPKPNVHLNVENAFQKVAD